MDTNKLLKHSAIAVFGQLSYIFIGFVGNIALSRMLSPNIFGQLALLMFFIGISNSLVEGGLGGALIQKKNTNEEDYSTIFIFNLFISIVLTLIIYFSAILVADYYNDASLINPLRVLSIIPFFNAFCVTRSSKLIKHMKFGERASYKALSLFIATLVAIAYSVFFKNIWGLVILYVLNSLVYTTILFFKVKSFDRLVFSKTSFKAMYSFGINTTLANLLDNIFSNIYNVIIAKYFSLSEVGLFYQSKSLVSVLETLYNSVINNVFFAHLSKLQDDLESFYKSYNKMIVLVSMITALVSAMIFLYSEAIIKLLYGEKWLGAVFYLKILSITFYFTIQEVLNRNIFKSLGKTYIILVIEVLKKIFYIVSIILGVYYKNIEVLMYGFVASSFVSFMLNYLVTKYILRIHGFYELKIVFISFILSFSIMYLLLTTFVFFDIKGFYTLFFSPILVVTYVFFYVMLGLISKLDLKKLLKKQL